MVARGKKLLKARRRALFKHSMPVIRRDDKVQVIAGDEKGSIGKVLKVEPARERVTIEKVNVSFRHVKKSQQNPQGGRIEREAPIHISNVLLFCEKCGKGGRVRVEFDGDDKKRVCARCGTRIGN